MIFLIVAVGEDEIAIREDGEGTTIYPIARRLVQLPPGQLPDDIQPGRKLVEREEDYLLLPADGTPS